MAELEEFNSVPLNELILTKDGQPISIPPEVIEDWRFTGLSNCGFVEFEMWNPVNMASLKWTLAAGAVGYNEANNEASS